jgi:hypothetical protein
MIVSLSYEVFMKLDFWIFGPSLSRMQPFYAKDAKQEVETILAEIYSPFCKLDHFIKQLICVTLSWKDLAYKKEYVNLRKKVLWDRPPMPVLQALKIRNSRKIDKFCGKVVYFSLLVASSLVWANTLAWTKHTAESVHY